MQKTKIGVVALIRNTFDFETAKRMYAQTKNELQSNKRFDWCFVDEAVMEPAEAEVAGLKLRSANVDAVVLLSATFHLGHLALIINKLVNKPMLLWGYDELPYNGGKIRLNSVCGVNLNASNLYKAGVDSYCCHVGNSIDENWLKAVDMAAALDHAHIGIAGYRADGFFNLDTEDLSTYRNTGALIDHYELSDLMTEPDEALGFSQEEIKKIFDCSGITEAQLEKTSTLTRSMEAFLVKNKLDALAIRCWPEFAKTFGCAPCGAMSLLGAKGYTLGCEGDAEGTISMLCCNRISPLPAFLADLSQVDLQKDYALMWHCGVAAYPLWDNKSVRALDTYFAGGKGVTADFVMREGEVTIMRIDTARGKTRLFMEHGSVIPMTKDLKGTYCKVRFDRSISDILNTVTETGVAHHVAMIYGDQREAFKKLARIKGFEVIE